MKLLTLLTVAVFSSLLSLCPRLTPVGVTAHAYATVGNNTAYAYANVAATGIKRGGYALTCTGRKPRAWLLMVQRVIH